MPTRLRSDGDPEHGEHVSGLGYYDAARDVYTQKPPPPATNMDNRRPGTGARLRDGRTQFRDDVVSTDELVQRARAAAFQPSASMEKARRLRDSDRDEDRRAYRSLSTHTRMQVGNYEQDLAAFVARGGTLPDGVRPPVPPKDAA